MQLGEPVTAPGLKARRHQRLRVRLSEISAALGVDVNLVPSAQADVDRLHAYRVLAHAEVEAYIESLAETALDVSEARLASGIVTHAAHHLVVTWSLTRLGKEAAAARYPYFTRDAASVGGVADAASFRSAIQAHRDGIKNNHGLKAPNVRRLLVPLGYRDGFYDPGLLDKLDSFGRGRGTVAHTTGVVGTTQWPSGSSELAATAALLPGLKRLEQFLPRLLRPI